MSPTAWLIWALVISTSFVSGHELVVQPRNHVLAVTCLRSEGMIVSP